MASKYVVVYTLMSLILAPTLARSEYVPNDHPTLDIRPAPGAIEVDGRLDDAGWAGAARAVNWTETWPGDQLEPPVSNEVFWPLGRTVG